MSGFAPRSLRAAGGNHALVADALQDLRDRFSVVGFIIDDEQFEALARLRNR